MDDHTPFEAVRQVPAFEQIIEKIEERVLSGQLVPGEHLPSARELMAEFGVSRSTVGEAYRALEASGLVRSQPGDPRGPEIRPFDASMLSKAIARMSELDEVGLGELVQFRMLLESSAYLLAANHATEAGIAEMEAALVAMTEAVDVGHEEFSRADVAFHSAVAAATGSAMIQVCYESVRDVVTGMIAHRIATEPDRREVMVGSLRHHAEMFAAVRGRDGDRAARMARARLHDYFACHIPVDVRPKLTPLLPSPTGC